MMSDRLFREDLEPGDHARGFLAAALTRLGAALAFVVAVGVFQATGIFDLSLRPVLVIVSVQAAVLVLSFPWSLRSRRVALAGVIFDLLAQTCVFWLLGPARLAVVLVVYVFGLIKTGLRLTRPGYFLVANAATFFYGMLVVLETRGIIPTFAANNVLLTPDQSLATAAIVLVSMNIAAVYVSSFDEFYDDKARALASAKLQLLDHSRILEERVRERTAEIRRANEQLAEKNRELGLYAAAVSHDLRSPMVAAGEALRVARNAASDAARERCMSLAADNLDRADRMLVGLRDLMRTVGTQEAVETVPLRALVQEVLDDLASSRGGATLPVRLIGDLGDVRAQSAKLRHVFHNLIANALEHGVDGVEGDDLWIEVGRDAGSEEATYYVRDNGAGIPYDYQARIFEPYRRGPQRRSPGMGLGLALVAQIVAEHGGRAWVESDPGAGATFRFTVPSLEDEERTP